MDKKRQENDVNKITLDLILYATIGTLCVALLSVGLKAVHLPEIKPELMFMPWGVALVLGISMAYKRGVQAEQDRQSGKDDSKKERKR